MANNGVYGPADWTSFYGAVLGPVKAMQALQIRGITSDSAKVDAFTFQDLTKQFGVDTMQKGTEWITLPDGTKVAASGNRGADLLTRIFGTSPLGGEREGVGGETVAPGTGGPIDIGTIVGGIEDTFARIAIIVLGFIFVAVGLSMFKDTGINILPK